MNKVCHLSALRQQIYLLLSALLREVPAADLLDAIHNSKAEWNTENKALDEALCRLSESAGEERVEKLEEDYHDLFVGVTQGKLSPYASRYLTGCLHEAPLVELRGELMELGVERVEGLKEPEDHLATLFEVMAWLSKEGHPRQSGFFAKYIAGWGGGFFNEMERSATTPFYSAVAILGQVWLQCEARLLG